MKRTFDVIGELGRILADLTGYNILLNELVQNADDDGNASSIRFDISAEALTVTHDGHFSECVDPEADQCSNVEAGDRPCDFHAFRKIGGRTKAHTAGTTGAFGIGFTAVYQVTDAPEIASFGRHWRVQSDGVTIDPCDASDCVTSDAATEGTVLRLPWARGNVSVLRQALGADAVPDDVPDLVEAAFVEHATDAILFTRRIHELQILRDGARRVRSQTERLGSVLAVTTEHEGGEASTRRFIHMDGSFDEAAAGLRDDSEVIDESRRAAVELLVPVDGEARGRFFATLPTEMLTGIPAHVNAEFYPASDRRSLNSEQSRGRWNELAVDAAAQALAEGLHDLRDALAPEVLWGLLRAAYVAAEGGSGYPGRFWGPLQAAIREQELVLTASGSWVQPEDAYLLASPDEQEHEDALEALGIRVVHTSVALHLRQGMPLEVVGLQRLTLDRLAADLAMLDMTEPSPLGDAHALFTDDELYRHMLLEIELLWTRASAAGKDGTRRTALLRWGDQVCRPEDLRTGDGPSRDLLANRMSLVRFPRRNTFPDEVDFIDTLLMPVDSSDVVVGLEQALEAGRPLVDSAAGDDVSLLEWLEDHIHRGDDELAARLAALPLFMAGGRLCSLNDAMLPGDFEDPAGAASLLDMQRLGKFRSFLERLGATTLTFGRYVSEVVPGFVPDGPDADTSIWSLVVDEVLSHSQQILEDTNLLRSLRGLPLARDQQGIYREPSHVYLPTSEVEGVIRTRFPVAQVPNADGPAGLVLGKLGAHSTPRPDHVLMIIDELRDGPSTQEARDQIAGIITYLSDWWAQRQSQETRPQIVAYQPLFTKSWLPARDHEGWFPPEDVFTSFQEAQARTSLKFLGLPLSFQRSVSTILDLLGVRTEPPVEAVVAHLLNLAGGDDPPSPAVYQRLDRAAAQEEVGRDLGALQDRPILFDALGERWLEPGHTFREEHSLGSRRYSIGASFPYGSLLGALGVRHRPEPEDAVRLLTEIAGARGEGDTRDDDAAAARQGWGLLADHWDELDGEALRETLIDVECVPISADRFAAPSDVVFKDSPHLARSIDLDALPHVISPDESTWRAQVGAGALNLSDDASPELVEVEGARPAPEEQARLLKLVRPIARVLAGSTRQDALTSLLAGLEIIRCDRLAVKYVLSSYPEVSNPVVDLPAVIVERKGQLYVTENGISSMAAARELVQYLVADGRPSQLIPTLRTVLSAESLEEAQRLLDEADIPELAEDDFGVLVNHELSDLGLADDAEPDDDHDELIDEDPATEDPATEDPVDRGREVVSTDDDFTESTSSEAAADRDEREESEVPEKVQVGDLGTNQSATERDFNEAASSDGSAARDRVEADAPEGTSGGRESRSKTDNGPAQQTQRKTRKGTSGKLRSYVISGSSTGTRTRSSDDGRQAVDEAGIAAVLTHEQAEGREPEEMPHSNPGFDVRSVEEDGGRRLIEVKSLGGAWTPATPAALSARQFREALEEGEDYWLYVVEHATNTQLRKIWKIRTPIDRVDQFLFDDGWREVADLGRPVTLRSDVELPDLMTEPGPGRVPFRDVYGLEPTRDVGFLGSAVTADGAFATYVKGAVLGDEYRPGTVVTVLPVQGGDEVEGRPVLVRLPEGQEDPDTDSHYCIRVPWPEEAGMHLQGGNGVEPIWLDTEPDILGLVVLNSSQ